MRAELSPQAIADLKAVARFSGRTWGRDRAHRYVAAIRHAVDLVERFPEIGVLVDETTAMRGYPVGRHIVYYRLGADALLVVRVLHASQDRQHHLP